MASLIWQRTSRGKKYCTICGSSSQGIFPEANRENSFIARFYHPKGLEEKVHYRNDSEIALAESSIECRPIGAYTDDYIPRSKGCLGKRIKNDMKSSAVKLNKNEKANDSTLIYL